jgi:hypothetical protein
MTLADIIRRPKLRKAAATATPATATARFRVNLSHSTAVATVAATSSSPTNLRAAASEEGGWCKDIEVEPASPMARPIYWEAMDGEWHGPVYPEYLGRTGTGSNEQFWVIVNHNGAIRWVLADLLRSCEAFREHERKRTGCPPKDRNTE